MKKNLGLAITHFMYINILSQFDRLLKSGFDSRKVRNSYPEIAGGI